MVKVLFFRPKFDLVTDYLHFWFELGINSALERGYEVIDLASASATKEDLFATLETYAPEIVIAGGHGSPSSLTGQDMEVVLEACLDDEIMTGTITHFLSCYTGQELGPSMVDKKTVWYIGYMTDFQFMIDTDFPVEADPLAEPFRDVTLAIITKILDGGTLKETWDAGIAECDRWIRLLWSRPGIEWAEVIAALQHDRDGMIGLSSVPEYYVLPPRLLRITPQQALGLGLIFLFLIGR